MEQIHPVAVRVDVVVVVVVVLLLLVVMVEQHTQLCAGATSVQARSWFEIRPTKDPKCCVLICLWIGAQVDQKQTH